MARRDTSLEKLKRRLEEAEETLRAIRYGQVDALVVAGPRGEQVYTLKGADQVYRIFLETMSEGAATVQADGLILYGNTRLSEMLKCPIERLQSAPLRAFCGEDWPLVEGLIEEGLRGSSRGEARFRAVDGSSIPVYLAFTNLDLPDLKALSLIVTDLTEQKKSEEILAAERLARSILDQAAEGIVVCDRAGSVLRTNRVARELVQSELLHERLDSLLVLRQPGTTRSKMPGEPLKIVEQALQGRSIHALEAEWPRPAGTLSYLQVSAGPLRNPAGEIVGCTVTLADITSRKKTEARLRTSEEHFRVALEGSPIVVYQMDCELRYTWLGNPAPGFTADFFIGHTDAELFPPDEAEPLTAFKREVVREGRASRVESRVTQDGQTRYWDNYVEPYRDERAEIVGLIGAAVEITERKRAEREREELLALERAAREQADAERRRSAFLAEASSILASSLDHEMTLANVAELAVRELADWCAIDLVAPDGTIQQLVAGHRDADKARWISEYRARFPIDPSDPVGVARVIRTGLSELHSDIDESFLARIAHSPEHREALERAALSSFMIVPLIGRGRTFGALSLAAGESGRHYTAQDLGLAEELGRRAALAVDNARLYRETQAAVRLRDQFFAVASHELKTPLTSMMGYAEILKRITEEHSERFDEREQRAIHTIFEQTDRMNRMVTALLDASRIETGQLSLQRAPLDLMVLAQRLVREIAPSLRRHKIELLGGESLSVNVDELRLEQAIQNLIQNAVKYSPGGGPVRVRVERRENWAAISVSDEGIGIPPEAIEGLFTRFFRAPNAETWHIPGMGIGLFVVKEIVELHGGRVEVESRDGQGSTFTILLPLMQ